MLENSSLSKHNVMRRSGRSITDADDKANTLNSDSRPAKRLKISPSDISILESERRLLSPTKPAETVSDSGDENEVEDLQAVGSAHKTDLESALPPISTDKAAIAAYEATRVAESSESGQSQDLFNKRQWVPGKSSIYVDAFNLALDTVLEDENHLFDDAETSIFHYWRGLSYEAQYLYVRLFLRKTSSWHRINRLRYHSDVADLSMAIDELQKVRDLPPPSTSIIENPGEAALPDDAQLGYAFSFADASSESITTLEEASALLFLDELKAIARDAKIDGKNKTELLRALRRVSGKQTGLAWAALKRSDTEETTTSIGDGSSAGGYRESTPLQNRNAHFVDKILASTGPCIRLSLPALKLFERVHLVFYRSTEWTEKSLTRIILARIARWNFPEYIVCRSTNIFPSRAILLEFEASIRTQFRLDSILESNGTPTRNDFQTIIDIFEDIQPRWKRLLGEEQQKEDSIYLSGEGAYLRRLSPAWVYTRIIHKGAYVLGKLKQHKREHGILTELLNQRLFHTSRRGDWYQRKALLEEHYMFALSESDGYSEEAKKKHWKRIALQTCEEGLQDRLVHLIYHYDLQKRISKIEKALKVPKREQHEFGHVRLAKPEERTFHGTQVLRAGRPGDDTRRSSSSAAPTTNRRGAKTVWVDPGEDENGGECSVEAMCLSNYRALGYQGYHSEGGILRTLFAYLFFDVLFVYIPDVFQTPFQTCPLDLHTDAFYPSRISEINQRLNEISNGEAATLIQRIWDDHHEKKTCVVGLDWSFEIKDLLSIARCFPPAALSIVCKVLAQEYGQRGGGVPDLFLWREETDDAKEEVMFAEVKSENDRLSDTQRLWIDVLSGAGIRVELCNARANEIKMLG